MHDSIDYIQRLRTLPAEVSPPYNWQEFQRRSAAARPATDWRPLAAAAALLLFVCAIAVWGRFGAGRHVVADSRAVAEGTRASDADAGSTAGVGHESRAERGTADLSWQAPDKATAANSSWRASVNATAADRSDLSRSRAIESWLASLPKEPAVVRVGTRAAVAGLEDRIAQVDDLMTSLRIDGMQPDGLADLQRERLRLVGSLAQVRYAEVVAAQ